MKVNFLLKIVTSFLLLFCFLFIEGVEAKEHKLEQFHIHTYIHEDGSATITERRIATLSEGTENFDIIENLGKSKITNFTVIEDGTTYDFVKNWNIDASQSKKAFKNSIIETENGYELVWGIGEYGTHEYELEYTVTDFIKQLDDSQILFWRYVNDKTNIPPENVTIEIETDKTLDEIEEKVWGFGFEGDVQFQNGKVIATSDDPFNDNNYATVLIQFKDGHFQTTDILDKTFEQVKDEAFQESDYKNNQPSMLDRILPILVFFTSFTIGGLVIFLLIRPNKGKRMQKKYKGEYERELPYNGTFIDLYQLLLDMNTTDFSNLLSAFILKWIKEERIDTQEEEVGFIFKYKDSVIYIKNNEIDNDDLDGQLFQMFVNAANEDGKLEKSAFAKWIAKNRKKIRTWEKDVKNTSIKRMESLNIFVVKRKRTFLFKRKVHEPTEIGKELKVSIYKYINYLRDYSLLDEHEAINVRIWDEIMIWAAILGITDEVYKQFRTLYPSYENESVYSSTVITASHSYSHTISNAKSYVSSSSGSGGSTSSGGGGGSFGGGSGGGTR